ncbi:MAG: FecR domain-containing protein [Hyphomonas sp.]|uniref:FecR domain-containing protein n=1 Tax=Hyphomonas sp. TaxID=87 RepID=UPI0034A08328
MRIFLNLLRTSLAGALASILLASPAQASPKVWEVSERSGEVSIDAGGVVAPAERGLVLNPGDVVETGEVGRAVIVRGAEYVILGPKSRIKISVPNAADQKTQIFQAFGSAEYKIEKKETVNFGVNTPYLAAVVKGTTFNVTVSDTGARVQVTEGKVEVSTLDGGASDLIVPGRIARVDAGDRQLLVVLGADAKTIRSPYPAEAGLETPSDASSEGMSNTTGRSSSSKVNPVGVFKPLTTGKQ